MRFRSCGRCSMHKVAFARRNGIDIEFFANDFAEIYEQPLLRKIDRVLAYLERVFSIHFFGNIPIQLLHKLHTLSHVAVCLVRFKEREILQMFARLTFVPEDATNLEDFRKSCDKQTLVPELE